MTKNVNIKIGARCEQQRVNFIYQAATRRWISNLVFLAYLLLLRPKSQARMCNIEHLSPVIAIRASFRIISSGRFGTSGNAAICLDE